MHTLVLASQSPRRRELLQKAGFEFAVSSVEISEIPKENLNLPDQIMDLAWQKAEALINSDKLSPLQGNLVLAADTVVVLERKILGKPESRTQAGDFIRRLSGRVHSVITGVCLWDVDTSKVLTGYEESRVTFRPLTEDEIQAYAESGEGLDKAGGYGIQGRAGDFVARLEGPLDNVIGLPVALVERLIKENGWQIRRRTLA